jgi:hypothetical protein
MRERSERIIDMERSAHGCTATGSKTTTNVRVHR